LSVFWLGIIRVFKQSIVQASLVIWPLILIAWGIYFISIDVVEQALINFVVALYWSVTAYMLRHKIPFAIAVLDAASAALVDNGGCVAIQLVCVFLNLGFAIFYTFLMVFCIMEGWSTFGAFLFAWVSYSWTAGAIANVAHCTTCGSVAMWWYLPDKTAASLVALKRACTTNFGSVVFGSFVIMLVDFVKGLVLSFCDNPCLRFVVEATRRVLSYFTSYTFVHVAVYGENFTQAASSTIQLFKSSGLDAIVNDVLLSRVLRVGASIMGSIVGGIGVAMYHSELPDEVAWYMDIFFFWVCYWIGGSMVNAGLNVIFSAVVTTFVMWAEDPAAMEETRPDFFNPIRDNAMRIFGHKSGIPGSETTVLIQGGDQANQTQYQPLVAQAVSQPPPYAQPYHGSPPQYAQSYQAQSAQQAQYGAPPQAQYGSASSDTAPQVQTFICTSAIGVAWRRSANSNDRHGSGGVKLNEEVNGDVVIGDNGTKNFLRDSTGRGFVPMAGSNGQPTFVLKTSTVLE